MRYLATAIIGTVLAMASMTPAMAHRSFVDGAVSNSPLDYPGAPKRIQDNDAAPYAMNYSEEAAQAMGVHDGQMDVFSTNSAESRANLPYLSGGVGAEGAMLKLQWHPGE
jgi:hypothetical protein